jgi:hypothetical protein
MFFFNYELEKDVEGSGRDLMQGRPYYRRICLEGLRKTMKHIRIAGLLCEI